jgi:hypothetical protein
MRSATGKDAGGWHESGMKGIANCSAEAACTFTESVPRSLFALAKRWQFYTLDITQGLLWGGRDPDPPSLQLIPYCPGFSLGGRSSLRRMLSEHTLGMQPESQERRMMRRFDMRLPAVVRLNPAEVRLNTDEDQKNEFHTETQNVSARGVFFYLDRPIPAGTPCEVTLTFPPHITLTDAVRVRFTARVIRVESPLPSSRIGTAAMIEDYEFLRSSGSTDFFSALQRETEN